MKLRVSPNYDLVLHKGILRKPINAAKKAMGMDVSSRESRSLMEDLRPMELRQRPRPRNASPRPSPPLKLEGFELEFEASLTSLTTAPAVPTHDGSESVSIPIEDVRQKKINACGDACINVLLGYHGLPHSSVGTNDRPLYKGMNTTELSRMLRDRNLRAVKLTPSESGRINSSELAQWLRKHGPLIAESRDHLFVINGVKGDRVDIHCPLLGPRTGSIESLNKYLAWSNPRAPSVVGTARMPDNLATSSAAAPLTGEAGRSTLFHKLTVEVWAKWEESTTKDWQTHGKGKGKDGTSEV